jgi:hypothetical protein
VLKVHKYETMEFWNLFNYVRYLHQEHIKLKQTYETLLSIAIQELSGIKARMEASEKQNIEIVEKKTHHPENSFSEKRLKSSTVPKKLVLVKLGLEEC